MTTIEGVLAGREKWAVLTGDSLKLLPELPAKSVDQILTDPPYGHNNNDGDLIHNWEKALGKPVAGGESAVARPIANDGAEANEIVREFLGHCPRLLREGGCCCCCCCGGGGPDPQFARWSLWMDEHLDFKQMVVWDKGPMGMGWHYRRSYETVLVGTKPGGPCKWYDETDRVENIIRPHTNGIAKIIPSGGRDGLDSTCTHKLSFPLWEHAERTALETSLKRATSGSTLLSGLRWSIDESGENITARCRSGSSSTIATEIRAIIESRTCNSSRLLNTNEFTAGAKKTIGADGGSRADNAERSDSPTLTTTNPKDGAEYSQSVNRAISETLLHASRESAWTRDKVGEQHPTPKPWQLAAHFIRLHSRPGEIILDPFAGHGWVGVAAMKMGRRFIGIEIDPQFAAVARLKIEAAGHHLFAGL